MYTVEMEVAAYASGFGVAQRREGWAGLCLWAIGEVGRVAGVWVRSVHTVAVWCPPGRDR